MADRDISSSPRLRADKWLWYARVAKTRSLAAALIKNGKVRLNSNKMASPSRVLSVDDVLTITLARQIKIIKIKTMATRRGPAAEAQLMYQDLTPAPVKRNTKPRLLKQAVREEGAGRPTKKQRRELSRFRSQVGEEY